MEQQTKIYFDASFLKNLGGIGRDSRTILSSLIHLNEGKKYEIVLINPIVHKFTFLAPFGERKLRIFTLALRIYCLIFNRPIVLNFPENSIFFQSQPSIFVTKDDAILHVLRLHDLFPITNPAWFRFLAHRSFKLSIDNINLHHKLLCDSETTRESVTEYFRKSSKQKIVATVMPCIPGIIKGSPCGKCLLCMNINTLENYFLSVSTIEPRKNYEYLVTVWDKMNKGTEIREKPALIIIGAYGWKSKRLFVKLKMGKRKNVFWVKQACDGSLASALKGTNALISASHNEGFNLPPSEALLLGTIVYLSDIRVHREIYGDLAIYFDTGEHESLINLVLYGRYQESNFADPRPVSVVQFIENITLNFTETLKRSFF